MDGVSTLSGIIKRKIADGKSRTLIVAVYLFGSCLSCNGRKISDIDPDLRMEYELKIKGMYFDFRPFLEELRAKSLAQL